MPPPDGALDRQIIDEVLRLLAPSCRREVESALDRDAELTIGCKQDIQAALSGYNTRDIYDAVPDLPAWAFQRHTGAAVAMFAAALAFMILRVLARRRWVSDGKKPKGTNGKKSKPKKSK